MGLDITGIVVAFLFLICAELSYKCGYERGRRDTVARFERFVETQARYRKFHPEWKEGGGDD